MYSDINVLLIDRDSITIEMNDKTLHRIKIKDSFDFDRRTDDDVERVYKTITEGTVTDIGHSLILQEGSQKFTLYFPPEFRFQVTKDLNKGIVFDLNYRKHLRQWFSKEHMVLLAVPGTGDGQDPRDFNKMMQRARDKGKEYSRGKNNKPYVIVSPNGTGSLMFTIIVAEKVVYHEHFFN